MTIPAGWSAAAAAVLLALGLSLAVAWTYARTYEGLAYVREFTHTLALAGVVSAMVLLAIGDEIARGVGLVGALTLIRFRSTLKDPRDLIFAFASLAAGVACGAQAFPVAVIGTAVFLLAAAGLSRSSFGARGAYDAVLRVRIPASNGTGAQLGEVLDRHCRRYALVQLSDAGREAQEHVYHLRVRGEGARAGLARDLAEVGGAEGMTLYFHDAR